VRFFGIDPTAPEVLRAMRAFGYEDQTFVGTMPSMLEVIMGLVLRQAGKSGRRVVAHVVGALE
jgi:hypothetical protein